MPISGRTYEIFRYDSASGAEAQAVVNPQRSANQYGIVQVKWAGETDGSEGFKLEIQGRATPSHGWVILEVIDETDFDDNAEAVVPIRLMPAMRAEVVSVTGSGTMSDDDIIATLVD